MKYLVCSDIHSRMESFRKALSASVSKDLAGVIIAGDLELNPSEVTDMVYKVCSKICNPKVYMVKGNCDYGSSGLQDDVTFRLPGDIRVLLTHGHKYHVKMDKAILSYAAESANCNMAIYGHTHVFDDSYVGSVHLINPGSVGGGYRGDGEYILMDVDDGIVKVQHKLL